MDPVVKSSLLERMIPEGRGEWRRQVNGTSDQLIERIAVRLKAMGNPVRIKILHALEDGELPVGQIVARVGSSQANISKQLSVLRGAGLVDSRREGVSVCYRITDPMVFDICRAVCDSLFDQANLEVETIEAGRDQLLSVSIESSR